MDPNENKNAASAAEVRRRFAESIKPELTELPVFVTVTLPVSADVSQRVAGALSEVALFADLVSEAQLDRARAATSWLMTLNLAPLTRDDAGATVWRLPAAAALPFMLMAWNLIKDVRDLLATRRNDFSDESRDVLTTFCGALSLHILLGAFASAFSVALVENVATGKGE